MPDGPGTVAIWGVTATVFAVRKFRREPQAGEPEAGKPEAGKPEAGKPQEGCHNLRPAHAGR